MKNNNMLSCKTMLDCQTCEKEKKTKQDEDDEEVDLQ